MGRYVLSTGMFRGPEGQVHWFAEGQRNPVFVFLTDTEFCRCSYFSILFRTAAGFIKRPQVFHFALPSRGLSYEKLVQGESNEREYVFSTPVLGLFTHYL